MNSDTPERAIVSLETNKAGAKIVCTGLILDNRGKILYMTGFGPTSEVRAFARLMTREADLEVCGEDDSVICRHYSTKTENPVRIARGPEGQSLVVCVPNHTENILAPTEEQARTIYDRILGQQAFVHQDWFAPLFDEMPKLQPIVGSMTAYVTHKNIQKRVEEGLKAGHFQFPAPTTHLIFEQKKTQTDGNEEQIPA